MTKKIAIPYFPVGLKYTVPVLLAVAIYLAVIDHFVWSVVLTFTGVVIYTTKYVTEINLQERVCHDYLFLLGLKLNAESKFFKSVDRIIITKGNHAQMVNTRAQSRQLDWTDYTGTLIFDKDTLDLLTKNDKKELISGLKEFADFLQVGIEDRTTNQAYWIDLQNIR